MWVRPAPEGKNPCKSLKFLQGFSKVGDHEIKLEMAEEKA